MIEERIIELIREAQKPLEQRLEHLEDRWGLTLVDLKELEAEHGLSRYMMKKYIESGKISPVATYPIKFKRQDIIKLINKLDTNGS